MVLVVGAAKVVALHLRPLALTNTAPKTHILHLPLLRLHLVILGVHQSLGALVSEHDTVGRLGCRDSSARRLQENVI